MDITRLLMRMALWLRHPPSRRHVWIMAIVAVVAAFCVGFEALFGWPEWLTMERSPRHGLRLP